MTITPKRPKRPADVIGNAVRVAQIATGEAEEEFEDVPTPEPEKDEAAAPVRQRTEAS
jgi:NADP-dependent 3-hydroxy acid dehydrogenase YdfG